MERIIRFMQDDYKIGVEARAGMPVVYLNPNALDSWSAERVLKLKQGDTLTREDQLAKKILAEQITTQLDEQSPGLSSKLSESQIEKFYISSLTAGPFVDNDTKKLGISIVNMPKDNQIDKEKILETFGITANTKQEPPKEDPNDAYSTYYAAHRPYQAFDAKHIKPLPGENGIWREMIGQHEGEHTNQENVDTDNNKDLSLTILDQEIKSDRAALTDMRAKGQTEVAQSFAHFRTFAAAEGDNVHATSIFLDQDDYKGITKEHMFAAIRFKNEMVGGVAAELNISTQDSETLRKADPQRFIRVLDEAMKNNRIPNPEKIDDYTKTEKIAAEMGLTKKEFDRLGSDRLPDIMATHDKLNSAGAFHQPGKENPYIKEYIEKYSSAVKGMFIEDTTPDATPKPETPAPIPKKSTEQVMASLSPDAMAKEAKGQSVQDLMYGAATTRLGITKDEASDLRYGNAEEKTRFYDAVEAQLKDGKIKAEFHRTQTETTDSLKKAMGVSDNEFKRLQEADPYKISHAYDRLRNEGALTVPYDNPHVTANVELEIKNARKELAEMKQKLAEMQASEAEEHQEEPEDAPEEAQKQEPQPETVNLAKPAQKFAVNGTPQVDLHGDTGPEMKIGNVSTCEYFAQQADPALVQQKLEQTAAPKPEQKPAPAQRPSPTLSF